MQLPGHREIQPHPLCSLSYFWRKSGGGRRRRERVCHCWGHEHPSSNCTTFQLRCSGVYPGIKRAKCSGGKGLRASQPVVTIKIKNNLFIKTSFPFSSIFSVLLIDKWKKQIMFSSGPFQILKKHISGSFPISVFSF